MECKTYSLNVQVNKNEYKTVILFCGCYLSSFYQSIWLNESLRKSAIDNTVTFSPFEHVMGSIENLYRIKSATKAINTLLVLGH